MASSYSRSTRGKSSYAGGGGGKSSYSQGGEDLEAKEAELRQMQEETGARTIPSERPGLFHRTMDLLSRLDYARAGATEELFKKGPSVPGQRSVAAIKRAGREIFSGIGDIKGEKKAFGEVLEDLGVPELGSLTVPIVGPGPTGKIPLKVTGRGAAGTALDFADPSILVSFGPRAAAKVAVAGTRKTLSRAGVKRLTKEMASDLDDLARSGLTGAERRLSERMIRADAEARVAAAAATDPKLLDRGGIKFAGRTIPGTAELATKASGVSSTAIEAFGRTKAGAAALEATRAAKPLYDAVGRVFNRDWHVRNLPEYIELKQLHLDRHAFATEELHKAIKKSAVMDVPKKRWEEFIDAIEDGTWRAKFAQDPKMLAAGEDFTRFNDEWFRLESEAGLMGTPRGLQAAEERLAKRIEEAQAPGESMISPVLDATRKEKRRQLLLEREKVLREPPIQHVESATLKNADEARYFKRRGWELVEGDGGTITAYRLKGVSPYMQEKWRSALQRIDKDLEALDVSRMSEAVAAQNRARDRVTEATARLAEERKFAASMRPKYAAHFYENSPEEVAKAVFHSKGKTTNLATIGRHAEERGFDTLKEAREWTALNSKFNKEVVPLKPVYDPVEILRRRGEASVDGLEFRKYYDEVKTRFAKQDLPFTPDDYFDLARPAANLGPAEWKAVKDAVDSGATDPKVYAGFSKQGRNEFMRQRIMRTKDPLEIINVLNKYGIEDVPRMRSRLGQLAEDGSPFVSFNLPLFKDLEIPKSIADDLGEMSERLLKAREVNTLLKWYDKGSNAFKSGQTIYFPSFHFRNAYSNVAQSFVDIGLAALNPRRHMQAIDVMRGAKGEFVTKTGERYTYDELRQMIGELQVRVSGRDVLEHTRQGNQSLIEKGPFGGKVKGAARSIGGATETEARTQLFLTHLRRGMSPEDAAARTKQFLYDYSNMSRVEKEWFSRAIPFYRFTRKNIQRQLQNLKYRPGMVGAELKPFRGREEENEAMTTWEGEALKLRLNKDGETLRVLTGVDLPLKQLDLLWKGTGPETVRGAVSMLSPFFKAPLEVGFGETAFTGRDFGRQKANLIGKGIELLNPPKAVKDWIGFKKEPPDKAGRVNYTFDGERFYILAQSWAQSRVVSTSERQWKTLLDQGWGPMLLDLLTGMRDKTFNMDEEQAKRRAERIAELERVNIQRGGMKEFRRAYVPKD